MIELIQQRITDKLSPTHLEIIDNSAQHIGHAGNTSGGGHYTVIISSDMFADQSLINCHKLVNSCVSDLIPEKIHALSIKIKK